MCTQQQSKTVEQTNPLSLHDCEERSDVLHVSKPFSLETGPVDGPSKMPGLRAVYAYSDVSGETQGFPNPGTRNACRAREGFFGSLMALKSIEGPARCSSGPGM